MLNNTDVFSFLPPLGLIDKGYSQKNLKNVFTNSDFPFDILGDIICNFQAL